MSLLSILNRYGKESDDIEVFSTLKTQKKQRNLLKYLFNSLLLFVFKFHNQNKDNIFLKKNDYIRYRKRI